MTPNTVFFNLMFSLKNVLKLLVLFDQLTKI